MCTYILLLYMRGTARASEQERESCLQARERERESLQQTYSRKKEVFCLFFEIYVLEKKLCPILRRWATTRNYIIWWWQYNIVVVCRRTRRLTQINNSNIFFQFFNLIRSLSNYKPILLATKEKKKEERSNT